MNKIFLKSILLFITFLFHIANTNCIGEKFVLTGGGGGGKSTLIELLRQQGYQTIPEAYTTIAERIFPNQIDSTFFSDSLYRLSLLMAIQLYWESQLDTNKPAFLDRSTIDIEFFCKSQNVILPQELFDRAAKLIYTIAFIVPVLPEDIYAEQLKKRPHYSWCDRVTSLDLAQKLEDEYKRHNVKCIHVPFGSTENMAEFIKQTIRDTMGPIK